MTSKNSAVSSDSGSFRDPAGFVFRSNGKIYRQVNAAGRMDFDYFVTSGLYDKLAGAGLIVAHSEVNAKGLLSDSRRYKILQPTPIPFISYPYEWTFGQLKSAALLTLQIQKMCLQHGMILKDASAYNIQFIGRRPIFIDSLSFRIYKPGDPWDGYKQFCEHFVAPLAVAAYGWSDVIRTLRVFLDGLPLNSAVRLLPGRSKLRRGLAMHLHLHAASQKKYDRPESARIKTPKVSQLAINGLIASLDRTIARLRPSQRTTEWDNYYIDTNYSAKAFESKKKIVSQLLSGLKPSPKMVWDLGANDGTFSELAAQAGSYVVSFDDDQKAVESNFTKNRSPVLANMILPLTQDLTNPSPPLGWAHDERYSLVQRGPADVVLALALVHHLAIGNNLPLSYIADFLSKIGRYIIIEFIPKTDSKTQILLRRRANLFADYSLQNFEGASSQYFEILKKLPVADSHRVIYLLKSKSADANDRSTQA